MFSYLEAVSGRKGRDEAEKTTVVETGLGAVAQFGVDVVSFGNMETEIRPDVDRELEREFEIVLQTGLCRDSEHESMAS